MRTTTRLPRGLCVAPFVLALAACEAHPEAVFDGGIPVTAPMDLSAGTTELPQRALPPDTPQPLTPPEETVSPHPRRSVPETYEVTPPAEGSPSLPSVPTTPVPETPAPTDGMPVMQPPVSDPIAHTPTSSDPMPIVHPAAPQTPAAPMQSGPLSKADCASPLNRTQHESNAVAQQSPSPRRGEGRPAIWRSTLSFAN